MTVWVVRVVVPGVEVAKPSFCRAALASPACPARPLPFSTRTFTADGWSTGADGVDWGVPRNTDSTSSAFAWSLSRTLRIDAPWYDRGVTGSAYGVIESGASEWKLRPSFTSSLRLREFDSLRLPWAALANRFMRVRFKRPFESTTRNVRRTKSCWRVLRSRSPGWLTHRPFSRYWKWRLRTYASAWLPWSRTHPVS